MLVELTMRGLAGTTELAGPTCSFRDAASALASGRGPAARSAPEWPDVSPFTPSYDNKHRSHDDENGHDDSEQRPIEAPTYDPARGPLPAQHKKLTTTMASRQRVAQQLLRSSSRLRQSTRHSSRFFSTRGPATTPSRTTLLSAIAIGAVSLASATAYNMVSTLPQLTNLPLSTTN